MPGWWMTSADQRQLMVRDDVLYKWPNLLYFYFTALTKLHKAQTHAATFDDETAKQSVYL